MTASQSLDLGEGMIWPEHASIGPETSIVHFAAAAIAVITAIRSHAWDAKQGQG